MSENVIEQNYFNACLVLDILEFTPPSKYIKLKSHLKRALPYVFTSIVFPLSILVTINFWAIYSNYPRVIDEDNVTESYFPSWVNHGLHSSILLLTVVEKFLVYRPYPARMSAFLGFSTVLTMYWSTCTVLYFIGGVWPYPLVSLMTTWQVLLYVYVNIILGCAIIRLGESLNNKIWGKKLSNEIDAKKAT
ncbi:hypothetical protein RUM44_010635 [Polyplax serrata]|uniref:Uncharacterized protein n=1 Tax=Polyplax serrata TaxID=468196 RepID=A0ABR1APB4_POLSC